MDDSNENVLVQCDFEVYGHVQGKFQSFPNKKKLFHEKIFV